MRRHTIPPRHDWRDRARALDFSYAEIAGEPYWDETACWEFTAAEIDTLDDALAELERLTRLAAAEAVRRDAHALLGVPETAWPLLDAVVGTRGAQPLWPHGFALGWHGTSETAGI